MIKAIDESFCTSCGLCVDICQMDVLRLDQGKAHIAYPRDCCNCMQCVFACPLEAITAVPGAPKKFDINFRWQQIKAALNVK